MPMPEGNDYFCFSSTPNPMLLEICAANLESAFTAQTAGAHRIELCSALGVGGLTPSPGTIRQACAALQIPVMVLIRPREGNFCYQPFELAQMVDDIRFCRDAGAAGVVMGALTPDGDPDWKMLDQLCHAASGMDLSFHRAFDFTANPKTAIPQLAERGFSRILSSGQAANAWEGREQLKEWVELAKDSIKIMPGAGVNAANIRELAAFTGAKEFHCSAKAWVAQVAAKAEIPGLEKGYWTSEASEIKNILNAFSK